MERIFKFFTERHLLATIITIAIILIGFITLSDIRKDLFPRVELNQVTITTIYPGASPEDVELKITSKIEKQLKAISSIEKVTSISLEDMSVINVRIDENLNNTAVDRVVAKIREAVWSVPDLPKDIYAKPSVERIRENLIPVINIGIGGKTPYGKLCDHVKTLEKKIKMLPGVAQIDRTGYRSQEITVEVSPKKIKDYSISIFEIADALIKQNIRATIGNFNSKNSTKTLVTDSRLKSPKDIGDVIVRSSFDSPPIKINALAKIAHGFDEKIDIQRINGTEVILLSVRKKENADITEVTSAIKNLIKEERNNFPKEIQIQYSNDLSRYVTASFDVVFNNAIFGFILVFIILALFLSIRVSFWVALGIPVSLLGAIAFLPLFGVCLDVVTMSAMILIIGIIVDDAIVIAERIYFHWEQGLPPIEAAVKGMKDIFWPVVTTVASTLLAFIPMFLIPGDIGKFIFVIPLVIILALCISLFEGVVALPAHVAHDIQKGKGGKFSNDNLFKKALTKLTAVHEKIMKRVLKKKIIFISSFFAVFILAIIFASSMDIEIFPTEGAEEFAIYMEAPSGTSLDETSMRVKRVEEILFKLPQDEIDSVTTYIGNQEGIISQENIAAIRVDLKPYSTRERNANQIIAELRKMLHGQKDFSNIRFDVTDSGPSPDRPISLCISGDNESLRKKLTDEIYTFLNSTEGIQDISRSDKDKKEHLKIVFNYHNLARYGLNVAAVSQHLRALYHGEEMTKMQFGSEEVKVKIRLSQKNRKNINQLLQTRIPNAEGFLIPLHQVARLMTAKESAYINHFNNERSVYIQSGVDKTLISPEEVTTMVTENIDLKNYPGINLIIEGAAQRKSKSINNIKKTFLLALAGIYLLLVLLFNSATQPLLVITAIPFGFMGVIFAFGIHGEPISFMAMLGAIGLTGVVVNDSLILVDHLNKTIKEKPDIEIINIIAAGSADRLRPILMTTITTAAGLLPLAYGFGGSDPFNAPMALALGWGLVLATPLTLILVPCLYLAHFDTAKKAIQIKISILAVFKKFWLLLINKKSCS